MKTLYLELNMGASGDMLMATLYDLIDEKEKFLDQMNSLGFDQVKVEAHNVLKSGINGRSISIIIDGEEEESLDVNMRDQHFHNHNHEHSHESHNHNHNHDHIHEEIGHSHESHSHHHHKGIHEVNSIINNMNLSQEVKDNAIAIYKLIGEAEATAHNKEIDEVHFHEVGTIDAIYDIVGSCILMEMIKPDQILASPVHVGSGHVKCAHGIMPVPAPATAYILKDVPIYGGKIQGELCTPTGAAILKHFVKEFGNMPTMKVNKISYGMGKKDFEAVNCVRGYLGEIEDSEEIVEFVCTIDDMTGEEIGFVFDILFDSGALEVFTSPIQMKKNRPGTMLTVITLEENRDKILELIFKHTSTIGLKEYKPKRAKLNRQVEIVDSEYGQVRKKVSQGYGVKKEKFEYDDIKKIALEKDKSIKDILDHLNSII